MRLIGKDLVNDLLVPTALLQWIASENLLQDFNETPRIRWVSSSSTPSHVV